MRPRTPLARYAVLSAAMLGLWTGTASHGQTHRAAGNKNAPQSGDALAPAIRSAIQRTLDQLQQDGDFAAGILSLQTSFDQVVAFAPASDRKLWRDAACVLRLAGLVSQAEAPQRAELMRFLLANPDLGGTLAFLVKPQDKPAEVFAVLARLRAADEKLLNTYANLAAALCVVHDRPLTRRINENSATAPDAAQLFQYFVSNEKRMCFGLRNVPAEILIYVVDSTASIDEMAWAIGRYAGNRDVGALFFVVDYDEEHFTQGDTKRVTRAGWNLPNILKYGGVCADQAYFAVSVGKAIGVPTAYVSAPSSEVSHAWVGFLQGDGRSVWWNFNSGRYDSYRGVRGNIQDPQTRGNIPDSTVSLIGEALGLKELDREFAAAMTDAAVRLITAPGSKRTYPPHAPEGVDAGEPRPATTDEVLKLLETGLTACPAHIEGWAVIAKLASDGKLSLQQKGDWEGAAYRLCGQRHPDFYLQLLEPMFQTVDDIDLQNKYWNAAFDRFASVRPDLAASVRMSQAQMWLKAQKPAIAGQCYEDVINRYANAGPFVIAALLKAEEMLRARDDLQRILALYEHAWSLIDKPHKMAAEFTRQSNYYRVGQMYAKRLDEAGLRAQASRVRTTIGQTNAGR